MEIVWKKTFLEKMPIKNNEIFFCLKYWSRLKRLIIPCVGAVNTHSLLLAVLDV